MTARTGLITAFGAVSCLLLITAAGGAWSAGVGEACGGATNGACAADLWCEPQAGKCGGADASGTCVRVPEICNKAYVPVCGCDTKTYGNDCERRAAKVRKAHDGACS